LKNDLQIDFWSCGLGADRLTQHGTAFYAVSPSPEEFRSRLEQHRPDWVISSATSIAAKNPAESILWSACRKLGIASLAFLDQWQNYRIRFSSDGENLDSLPDFINAIDGVGRAEMRAEGFPSERLLTFGHPYLDLFTSDVRKRRATRVAGGVRRIGFVSEAIREFYGHSRGYDQWDAFRLFFEQLSERRDAEPFEVLVKLHPKESASEHIGTGFSSDRFSVRFLRNEVSAEDFLTHVDEVWGMTSILLIQSYLCGVPTFSIQPHLRGEDPLILTRAGLIPLVGCSRAAGRAGSNLDYQFKKDEFLSFLNGGVK
jgi:hypothetical protein